jgi:hypothetical protein
MAFLILFLIAFLFLRSNSFELNTDLSDYRSEIVFGAKFTQKPYSEPRYTQDDLPELRGKRATLATPGVERVVVVVAICKYFK